MVLKGLKKKNKSTSNNKWGIEKVYNYRYQK